MPSIGAVAQASEELDNRRAGVLEAFETWFAANAPAEAKGGPDVDDDGDALDVGEAFERLEMDRVAAEDPDSLAYFHAQKRFQSSLRAPAGKRSMKK